MLKGRWNGIKLVFFIFFFNCWLIGLSGGIVVG